jgi:hypothetical protein
MLQVHGDAVVVELLSENNWSHLTNDIAFESNNAEDGVVPKRGLVNKKN